MFPLSIPRICCVATHFEKIRHFEKKFQSALNLGPNQRTLKKKIQVLWIWDQLNALWKFFSKCVKSLHLHFFWCTGRPLMHFEKNIHGVRLLTLCFHLIDRILKYYYSFFTESNWSFVVENRKLKEKQYVTIVLYDYDIGNNKVF